MKGFFGLFIDSARSLKQLRTITTTGMLLAMAVAVRSLGVEITPDIRIVFTCVPICITALLYGPVVCGLSTVALDLIGFIIDNRSARMYSPQLALVVMLSGIIYGIFLYKKNIRLRWQDILRVALARLTVIVVCNICLNSYFLYTLYTNPDAGLMSIISDENIRSAFLMSVYPRAAKNLVQFPFDVILLAAVIPAAQAAYNRVRGICAKN